MRILIACRAIDIWLVVERQAIALANEMTHRGQRQLIHFGS